MKYKSTIKSRQFILAENGEKIFIEPGEGEMKIDEALSVAKSPWGKHLIENKLLEFEKPVEVKEEEIQRGMSILPGSEKTNRHKKPKPKSTEADTASGGAGDEGGNTGDGAGDGSGSGTGDNEIPDFSQGSGSTEGNEGAE